MGASWAHLGASLHVLAYLGPSWSRLGAVLTLKKNLALQLNGKRAYCRRRLDFELSCCFVLQLPVMKFFDSVCVVSFCLFCLVLFVLPRFVSSYPSCVALFGCVSSCPCSVRLIPSRPSCLVLCAYACACACASAWACACACACACGCVRVCACGPQRLLPERN